MKVRTSYMQRRCGTYPKPATVSLDDGFHRRQLTLHLIGGFCGYRNIQTLVSYLIATRSPGSEHFGNRLPTVLEIQDLIEQAWDKGYNPRGRLETGGIKQTRKFIGTPEVCTGPYFTSRSW